MEWVGESYADANNLENKWSVGIKSKGTVLYLIKVFPAEVKVNNYETTIPVYRK